MRRPLALAAMMGIATGLASMRCAEATAVVVEVYSEVPCSANAQVVLFGGRSLTELASAAPAATATTCTAAADGTVRRGSVVLTPAASNDETIAFALVTRPDGASAETGCFAGASGSCIVAKRQLRFLSRTTLTMRVDLRASCLGVTCDPTSTCVKGKCVDPLVDGSLCGAKRCDEADLVTPGDGGVDGGLDGGPDAIADVAADVPVDGPVVSSCVGKPVGAVQPLSALNQSASADIGLGLTADQLFGVMWSDRSGIGRLFTTERAQTVAPFPAPTVIPGIDTPGAVDRDPSVSSDGLQLVFASNRGSAGTGFDLYSTTRATRSGSFGAPQALAALNSNARERTPFLTSDALALYFVRGDVGDLLVSRRANGGVAFGPPTPVSELNTASDDAYPVVTSGERTIYFASDRPGSKGVAIWRATRANAASPFGPAERIVDLDSNGDDVPLWVSPNECTIYLSRDSAGTAMEIYAAARLP